MTLNPLPLSEALITVMSRKEFEIFLYKTKLNQFSLLDLLPKLSGKTIQHLMRDFEVVEKSTADENQVYIFTDGNCKRNGKTGAKGGYAVFFSDKDDSPYYNLNYSNLIAKEPTNQKAELLAMQKAFEIVQDNGNIFNSKQITIVSDSMYAIKCLTEWSKNWVRNNWKTAKGEAVKNDLILKRILELKNEVEQTVSIKFKHIHSHTVAPSDQASKEYLLWYGNHKVDEMINQILI
jgi:ribonuclease HI